MAGLVTVAADTMRSYDLPSARNVYNQSVSKG